MEKKKRIRIALVAIALIIVMAFGVRKYGDYQYAAGYYEAYEKGSTKGYQNGYAKGQDDGYANGYNEAKKAYYGSPKKSTASSKSVEFSGTSSSQSEEKDYIVNANTNKFHTPSCSYADRIKGVNKYSYTGTREQLIDWGYSPCQKCNP